MTSERPFTPERLAERWVCTPAHIRNLCKRGDLPHFRIGKEYRIPHLAVLEVEGCDGKMSGSRSTEESGPLSGETEERPDARPFRPRIVTKHSETLPTSSRPTQGRERRSLT